MAVRVENIVPRIPVLKAKAGTYPTYELIFYVTVLDSPKKCANVKIKIG